MAKVKRSDKGMVSATIIAARKCPKKTYRIRITSTIPLIKMFVTVSTVVWISTVRS